MENPITHSRIHLKIHLYLEAYKRRVTPKEDDIHLNTFKELKAIVNLPRAIQSFLREISKSLHLLLFFCFFLALR